MQDHENEREQDPVYGTGGEQPPPSRADSQESPAHETPEQPQPPPPDMGQQADHPSAPQTDAIWFGGQLPPAASPQPSGYGTAPQPPPYPGAWAPPGGWAPPPGGQWSTSPQPPEPPNRRNRRVLSFVIVAILGVGIGAAAAFGIAHNNTPQSAGPSASSLPTPGSQGAPLHNTGTSKINVSAIANAVTPSVANISSRLQYQNATAEGTGIVISSSGLVLTNNHVVDGATQVTVQSNGSGRSYPARVLGTDRTKDVALLQLQGASGLKAASIGDSSKVKLGDPVVAIGNLNGQGGPPTVTSGAITALNRTITAGDQGSGNTETLNGVLQTNAQIGSGDSGGPLVNASGQVIGMDTAAASRFGQSQSVGFAIPINHAVSIAREIAAGRGSSTIQIGRPAFLGVSVCPSIAKASQCLANGLDGGGLGNTSVAPVDSGALVQSALHGTPAQAVGISAGDVITGIDGASVTSGQSLTKSMHTHRPGDKVSVTWVDTQGQRHTATVTLITGPAA